MSCATRAPIVRTAWASAYPFALCLLTLALSVLTLAPGLFSAFFAPGAAGIAPPAGGSALSMRAEAEAPHSSSFRPSADAPRVSADRHAPSEWSVEFETAEFDQEDEEENVEGAVTDAPGDATPDFSRAPSAKFRRAASAFSTRIGDFRRLPRAPPARG